LEGRKQRDQAGSWQHVVRPDSRLLDGIKKHQAQIQKLRVTIGQRTRHTIRLLKSTLFGAQQGSGPSGQWGGNQTTKLGEREESNHFISMGKWWKERKKEDEWGIKELKGQ